MLLLKRASKSRPSGEVIRRVDHDDPDHVEMLFRKSRRSTQTTTPATNTTTRATAAATTAIGVDFKAAWERAP
jgi:hypothetical protein